MSILSETIDELCPISLGAYELRSEFYLPVNIEGWWRNMKDVPETQFSCLTHLTDLLALTNGMYIRIEIIAIRRRILKCLYHIECEPFTWTFEFDPILLPIEVNRFIKDKDPNARNDIPGFITVEIHEPEIEYMERNGYNIAKYKI